MCGQRPLAPRPPPASRSSQGREGGSQENGAVLVHCLECWSGVGHWACRTQKGDLAQPGGCQGGPRCCAECLLAVETGSGSRSRPTCSVTLGRSLAHSGLQVRTLHGAGLSPQRTGQANTWKPATAPWAIFTRSVGCHTTRQHQNLGGCKGAPRSCSELFCV